MMELSLFPYAARIAAIELLNDEVRVFTFSHGRTLSVAPGQFVEISLPGIGSFPASACGYVATGMFQACIRRVGRVTDALFRCRVGDELGLRGPLGRGFPLSTFAGKDLLLIAGGLGIAPVRALLQRVMETPTGQISLIYGARQRGDLLFLPELEELAGQGRLRLRLAAEEPLAPGVSPEIWTRGTVIDPLAEFCADNPRLRVVACGPPQMYAALQVKLAGLGVAAEAVFTTLERRMCCGIGECGHCVAGGHYVCTEGPVFSLRELESMPGALS